MKQDSTLLSQQSYCNVNSNNIHWSLEVHENITPEISSGSHLDFCFWKQEINVGEWMGGCVRKNIYGSNKYFSKLDNWIQERTVHVFDGLVA